MFAYICIMKHWKDTIETHKTGYRRGQITRYKKIWEGERFLNKYLKIDYLNNVNVLYIQDFLNERELKFILDRKSPMTGNITRHYKFSS